jgi:hypothetical protein
LEDKGKGVCVATGQTRDQAVWRSPQPDTSRATIREAKWRHAAQIQTVEHVPERVIIRRDEQERRGRYVVERGQGLPSQILQLLDSRGRC